MPLRYDGDGEDSYPAKGLGADEASVLVDLNNNEEVSHGFIHDLKEAADLCQLHEKILCWMRSFGIQLLTTPWSWDWWWWSRTAYHIRKNEYCVEGEHYW